MTEPSLTAATEAALAAEPQQRTVLVEHAGKKYIAKRLAAKPRRLMQTLFMRWLVRNLTGQPLPLRTLALSEAAYSMGYEAQRLSRLADAGVSVPALALQTQSYLLLEHRGTVVATLLESWPPSVWREQLGQLADELARFHAAGHWHGGAQIKNLTMQDGRFTRIDFEENFGEFLPLPAVQSNDLILFLNSISLAGPIDEAEARRLLPLLLRRYSSSNPDPNIVEFLRKALPWFKRLTKFSSPFRRFSRKGIRRMEILVEVLDHELTQP